MPFEQRDGREEVAVEVASTSNCYGSTRAIGAGSRAVDDLDEPRMASSGGKPPLIQRYRMWPLLSHNPCSGPDRGAGHETPRFYNFTRRRNGWMAIRRACAAEGDAGDRLPRQRLARPESRGLLLISSLYGYCSDFIKLHHFRPSDQGEFEGAGPRRWWANFSARAPARDYGSSGK